MVNDDNHDQSSPSSGGRSILDTACSNSSNQPNVALSPSDSTSDELDQASTSQQHRHEETVAEDENQVENLPPLKKIKLETERCLPTSSNFTDCQQETAMDYSKTEAIRSEPRQSPSNSTAESAFTTNRTNLLNLSTLDHLRAGPSTASTTIATTTLQSQSKQSKKSLRQMIRLTSPNSHGRCLYFPGAYSSQGQLSSQLRRQCALAFCCHCQHPFGQQSRAPPPTQVTPPIVAESSGGSSNGGGAATGRPGRLSPNAFLQAGFLYHGSNSESAGSAAHCVTTMMKHPESLLEITSRLVAEHIPYEYIEQRYSCIPEPVQRRIIFWSFPRDECYIRLYSSISSIFKQDNIGPGGGGVSSNALNYHLGVMPPLPSTSLSSITPSNNSLSHLSAPSSSSTFDQPPQLFSSPLDSNNSSSLFNSGLLLMLSGAVHQVMQVGFNLSGVVTNASPFNSITSGSGVSYYPSNGIASSSSSSLEYNSLNNPFISSGELARYNLGGSSYLNSRDPVSLFGRSKVASSFLVSITFDRCKITSVTCTCTSREYHLFWCEHVVALALHRIRKPLTIELRVPISESLLEFDREQLQKLLQYLIAEHHVQILPTVQRLVDELSHKRSSINLIAGAPDPTAGACVFGRHDWYLNEEKISNQVRDLVKYVSVTEAKQIIQLFYKIVEMLKIKDSNGPRFLRIITEQFLYSYIHVTKSEDSFANNDPFIYLWDHLTNLWIHIVIDLNMSPLRRVQWRDMFRHWSQITTCPREDTYFCLDLDITRDSRFGQAEFGRDYLYKYEGEHSAGEREHLLRRSASSHHLSIASGSSSSNSTHHNRVRTWQRRRILERAYDATFLTWDDAHLQMIIKQDGPVDRSTHLHFAEYFDHDRFPIWSEHLPTAAVRVASLRVNGYNHEALRLAMAIVRYLKHCQYQKQQQLYKHRAFCEFEFVPSSESWIGNPIDPIGVIFDTLAEASLAVDSKPIDACYALVAYDKKFDFNNPFQMLRTQLIDLFLQYNEVNCLSEDAPPQDRPKYRHVQVTGSSHRSDTYLAAAVTIALIGLAQHRRSPDIDSQRDRALRQEVRLIRKLLDIKLDTTILAILQQQSNLLLEIGLLSDLVHCSAKNVPYDIAQIPGLVRFLFGALFLNDPNLAYDIGLRSLRFFKEEPRSRIEHERSHKPRIISYYLDLQLILAKTMLFAARNDQQRLELIFLTIKGYVNNTIYLNRLAYGVFQFSLNGRHEHLLQIAYAFGLHLTKITLNDSGNDSNLNRKQIIQWMVSCAGEIGFESILHLMQKWKDYFTPSEAVRQVASAVLSMNLNVKICNHIYRQDELAAAARKLAVECALQDPANCALTALSLCEKDQAAFDTISTVVEKAGAMCHMNAQQLFTVARYLEHQGIADRACKIALLAAGQVNIPLSADTHPLIGELQWSCSLSQGLGTAELTELVKILVKNVRCAPVLADMIRRCTFPQPPLHTSKHMMLQSNLRHASYSSDPAAAAAAAANLGTFMEHHTIEERMRRRQTFKTYPLDRPPLCTLLNAAVRAYIETVMKRLEHISPRHYSDFIEFLTRAQETIVLAPDGSKEFATLLEKIKTLYKGKKKLMFLVRERFR